MDDGIDRYLRIIRVDDRVPLETNGVIVEWNVGYFLNVADYDSVGVLRWLDEMGGHKIW